MDVRARIVALAENPWHGPWMNRQQLLSRLARMHSILYTTGAWSTWDIGQSGWGRARWFGDYEQADGVLVDHAPALLLRVRNRPWFDRRALRLITLRWKARLNGEGGGPLVGYVFHPKMWPYAKALQADALVYHAYDLFSLQVGWNGVTAAYERELIDRANLVLGSSEVICDDLLAKGARRPILLPNAADFSAYAVEPEGAGPADLADIRRPRIGYIGKLSRKVDLALVASLAKSHPRWHFVFVGSCDNLDTESERGIALAREVSNVHFLGYKNYTALPDYAVRMDANIICHRLNDALWTKGTFPLKLFEYLAAGAPVVSSDIPSVRRYDNVVALVRTPDEWDRALTDIIERGSTPASRDQRRAIARENTWDQRVSVLQQHLQGIF